MGSPELGRQWPQAALQESLQTSPSWRHVHTGAAALGVVCQEEEADGKGKAEFCSKAKIPWMYQVRLVILKLGLIG